jgi:hypothetical protein
MLVLGTSKKQVQLYDLDQMSLVFRTSFKSSIENVHLLQRSRTSLQLVVASYASIAVMQLTLEYAPNDDRITAVAANDVDGSETGRRSIEQAVNFLSHDGLNVDENGNGVHEVLSEEEGDEEDDDVDEGEQDHPHDDSRTETNISTNGRGGSNANRNDISNGSSSMNGSLWQLDAETLMNYPYVKDADKLCGHCKRTAIELERELFCCGQCLRVYYCDTACQRAHWKQHREPCKQRNVVE